jgi:DnaK suppressor protein
MRQKIEAVPTTNRSAPDFERQLPTLRAELNQQRQFRTEQLQELAVEAAEAVASGDQNRLQVARILTLAAESALSDIDTALQRLADGSYGVCERCAESIPWERLGAADDQTVHPMPVPRRVWPARPRAPWPYPIPQPDTVTGEQ